jgi:hypothetical protein
MSPQKTKRQLFMSSIKVLEEAVARSLYKLRSVRVSKMIAGVHFLPSIPLLTRLFKAFVEGFTSEPQKVELLQFWFRDCSFRWAVHSLLKKWKES